MKISIDKEEGIRGFINLQYVKMKEVAAVGSLILLIFTNSLLIYNQIEWRGIHPYFGVPLIIFAMSFTIWLAAHIYIRKMEMYRTEQMARLVYNPYACYAIQPFEEMRYRYQWIPLFRYLSDPENPKNKLAMKNLTKLWQEWVDMGYVPKKYFPLHLHKFYITDKERRI